MVQLSLCSDLPQGLALLVSYHLITYNCLILFKMKQKNA